MQPSNVASERIDLLDDAGCVIGETTRAEMRRLRLPHRCVYVFVFHPDGRLLIHRRTETKEVFPGCWDVAVGGVVAAREDWFAAAQRETAEEIGVAVEPEHLFDFQFASDFGMVFGQVYKAFHTGPFSMQASEVAEIEFVPGSGVEALISTRKFCPDGVAAWRRYAAKNRAKA